MNAIIVFHSTKRIAVISKPICVIITAIYIAKKTREFALKLAKAAIKDGMKKKIDRILRLYCRITPGRWLLWIKYAHMHTVNSNLFHVDASRCVYLLLSFLLFIVDLSLQSIITISHFSYFMRVSKVRRTSWTDSQNFIIMRINKRLNALHIRPVVKLNKLYEILLFWKFSRFNTKRIIFLLKKLDNLK